MAKQYTREEMKARMQAQIDAGSPIVITGAGTGISAKFAERGGADMIGLFNSSYLGLGRVEATSLMPYGNANDIVMSLGDRIFPVVQNTPILGGIIGSDPTREMTPFLKIMQFKGFPAVINFPSPGVAIGHQAGRLDTAQAQVARVEQADHVRTAALCKLCGNADASAGDDDGLTGVDRCLESLLDFLTGETFCHNASSLYS